jgi:hypothetical protein
MFIPDPGYRILIYMKFYLSRIPDSITATKEEGEKICNHKYHKIENYFSFELVKKKIEAIYKKL